MLKTPIMVWPEPQVFAAAFGAGAPVHACRWLGEEALQPICKWNQGEGGDCFKKEPMLAETLEAAEGMGRQLCLNCAKRVRASILVRLCPAWNVPSKGRDGVPAWNPRRGRR